MKKVWTPDILSMLIKESGKSVNTIAEDAGIGPSTLKFILAKRYPLSVDALMALSDYFGVTTDFLCGRVSENDLPDIQTAFHEYFTGLVRCSYEKSLEGKPRKIPAGYLAVWPYNLLDDIFLEPVSFIVNEDQMNGLMTAIDTLTPRERELLLLCYKDGNSFIEIGKAICRTNQCVSQIVHKAIRKLRHPARMHLILDGVNGSQAVDEERGLISNQKRKLIQERMELEKLKEECKTIAGQKEELEQEKIELLEKLEKLNAVDPLDAPLDLAELDLSVRSFNCLMRADFKSMRELLDRAKAGELYRVRNFGVKCTKEVLQKLYDYGYITYAQAAEYAELNKVNDYGGSPWAPMIHERKEETA